MSAPKAVLDASALLAWVREERGKDTVAQLAGSSVITAANMAEVLYRAAIEGYQFSLETLQQNLINGGFAVIDNTAEDAATAGTLIAKARSADIRLSLGDGLCLAAAIRLNLPAVCGDQDWEILELPIKVLPFR